MAPSSASLDCTQRLADQLQSLTEVAETLTLRLLDLEERFAAQEQALHPLLAGDGSADREALEVAEVRLDDTEQRLGRLESLLNAPLGTNAGRHLQSVPAARLQDPDAGSTGEAGSRKPFGAAAFEPEAFHAQESAPEAFETEESETEEMEPPLRSYGAADLQEDFDLELQQA